MSFWKKKNLPAVPPKQEVLPPQDRAITPASPEPTGVVRSNIDAFVTRQNTKSIISRKDNAAAQADMFAEQHRAVTNYEKLAKGVNRLDRLDDIIGEDNAALDEEFADNDHKRKLAEAKRQAELAAFQASDERDRMTRDLDYMKTQTDKRRALVHAQRQETDARIRRETVQRTADMQVEQAVNAFLTGDYATLDKLMQAKQSFEKSWGDDRAPREAAPIDPETRLAVLQQLLAKAERDNDPAEIQLKLRKEIDAVEDAIENADAAKDIP